MSPDGSTGSLFDMLEESDAKTCRAMLRTVAKQSEDNKKAAMRNQAFVFIKPGAMSSAGNGCDMV